MRLFVERGFDEVTTIEIARDAGVSPATLFNHFPTKEDLVFGQVDELEHALAAVVLDCPPGQSILRALQEHVLFDLTAGRAYSRPEHVAPFHQLIVDSPELQAREGRLYQRREQVVAEAVAQALGADAEPVFARVVAALFIAAERVIAAELRARLLSGEPAAPALRQLEPFIDSVFAVIRRGIGDLSSPRRAVAAAE